MEGVGARPAPHPGPDLAHSFHPTLSSLSLRFLYSLHALHSLRSLHKLSYTLLTLPAHAPQVALQVSLPEIDGAIEPVIYGGRDGVTGHPYTLHPAPDTLAPLHPYTLTPLHPYTLHPYTLQPYTLHPTPYS